MSAPTAPVRIEVRPRSPFTLPRRSGLDGLTRVWSGVLHRLVHAGDQPVLVRVAQPARNRVVFAAVGGDRAAGEWAIERMRGALGVDLDLGPFYDRFPFDPLIGRSIRADPGCGRRVAPTPSRHSPGRSASS